MDASKPRFKHMELWVIGFVIMVITASVAFAYGCSNMNKKDPGLYEIIAKDNSDVPYYGSDYSFYYYLDGDKDVNTELNEVRTFYSDKLSYIYASLDEETDYSGYVSIAKLNAHINEEVEVPTFLYNTLKDAYNKTLNSNNYSIFASPLYSFWARQMSLTKKDREANDPLNNEASVAYLSEVASYTNSREDVDLVFGANSITLKVSDAYQKYMLDNKITAPYISLNVLKNSYVLEEISNDLWKNDYTKGFIISNDGSVAILKNSTINDYAIYSVNDLTLERAANIVFATNPSAGSVFRRFNLNKSSNPANYYFIKDNITYFRSMYINTKTGLQNNLLLSSGVYNTELTIVDKAFINNEIVALDSLEAIKEYLEVSKFVNTNIVLNLVNDYNILYISGSLSEFIKLNTEFNYHLTTI